MRTRPGWILSPRGDFLIFTGPILLGLVLVAGVARGPGLDAPLAPWAFLLFIVCCDVAHVWATAFRVYLDPARLARRPGVFLGIPLIAFGAGVLLYASSPLLFWRVLAYLAVWHFIRQQWGWVAYSRRAAGERDLLDRRLDQIIVANVTIYPLVFWHAHLPRAFDWFVPGDFLAGLPPAVDRAGLALHWIVNGCYLLRQVHLAFRGSGVNLAKLQIVFTTWCAWYGGIVLLNSDWAFTVFNVLHHGVPYLAVVHRVESRGRRGARGFLATVFRPRALPLYLGLLILAGYMEEWFWDRLVWNEHGMLFLGPAVDLPQAALILVVPLLALPQATHYLVDGWIWKFRSNPELAVLVEKEEELN